MSAPVDPPSFPLQAHLGFVVERGDGRASASVELDERHLNPNAVSHGAVAFTLMDTAMGAAVMSVVDEGCWCATIEMHTRFLRSVAAGRLTAEASVLHPGRRIVHLEARTVDDEGRLVATATASFAVIRPPALPEARPAAPEDGHTRHEPQTARSNAGS